MLRPRPDNRTSSAWNQADVQIELEQQRRLGEADAYLEWLFKNLEPYIGQRVLDVGCAIGNITQFLLQDEKGTPRERVVGIDVAPEMVAEIRHRFRDRANFRAVVCDITRPESQALAEERPDTVVCAHVLEHVYDDEAALRHMRALLPEGGRLILLVPVVKWVWGRLDEATGHQRRYTWRELEALLQRHGFAVEDHWYVNFLAIFGWFFTGRILRREIIPTGQYSLYNKLTPLLARLETWIRPPIGLSVACVCRAVPFQDKGRGGKQNSGVYLGARNVDPPVVTEDTHIPGPVSARSRKWSEGAGPTEGVPRILLVVPPGLPGSVPNHEGAANLGGLAFGEGGFRYPPHTVATVAATARAAGYALQVIDAPAQGHAGGADIQECLIQVRAAQADLIGVFVSWATAEGDVAFLRALRREGDGTRPVPVIVFGAGVAHLRDRLLAADHVLEGEPELAFVAAARRLLGGTNLPQRLTARSLGAEGYDEQGLLKDLDALPYPAWDLLPWRQYPYLTVLSSRGCTGTCRWCPYIVAQGRRFRACSPGRVIAELAHLVQTLAPPRIVFRDPAFAHDRARVVAICRGILRRPELAPWRNLLWECESRPEHLDDGLLRLMSLAGCVGVKIGLETLDEGLLRGLGRLQPGWDARRYRDHLISLVASCQSYGIAPRLFAMTGLPGQTMAMIEEVGRLVAQMGVELSVQPLKRYPGQRLEESVVGTISAEGGDVQAQIVRLRELAAVPMPSRLGVGRWRRVVWRAWRRVAGPWEARRG
ncbi:MAG: methyltransferase domain-containing protein [Chloroflexi bacterium]|nr:methyltransferase domain-containing protein [Chloroflexota bacterium]